MERRCGRILPVRLPSVLSGALTDAEAAIAFSPLGGWVDERRS